MNTSASLKKSPLKFFVLVFALSLPFWLIGAIAEHFSIGLPYNLPVSALMFPCPLIAAFILVYREEKRGGIRRLLKRVFGKYKDDKKVGPIRIELPFQTVETVNETAKERQLTLDRLFSGQETEWRNRLIWGDKKYILPSLLPEFAGQVNLIYIDPPFATGDNFSFNAEVPYDPDNEESQSVNFIKQPSLIEQKAYRDTWGRGLDSYLQWFYETVVLLRELLTEDGSIYVHLDWHVGDYAKAVLDEVFGYQNFRNRIIWQRFNFHADAKRYGIVSDEILF
jgi:hypothetical protein